MTLRTVEDEAFAIGMIQAAMVLHNLLVRTWKDYVTEEDIHKEINDARPWRDSARAVYEQYSHENGTPQRRELLVREMLALNPPEVPIEEWLV